MLATLDSALQLKRVKWLDSKTELFCVISSGRVRPYVTKPFRRQGFLSIHSLAHPGIKSTVKLIKQGFVCPSIEKDCREWTRSCVEFQRAKVIRHVVSPIGQFATPSTRFEHVHIDLVGLLPIS